MKDKNHSTISLNEDKRGFFDKVIEVAKLIPKGKVTSYGAIAEYLGAKKSARMVGWALNNCLKDDANIPAHRVVNRNGMLSGKHNFGKGNEMQNLLEKEGLIIKKDCVVDFRKHLWLPWAEEGY